MRKTVKQIVFSHTKVWAVFVTVCILTIYIENKVLPGGGLAIPGRHVNEGGYVSDEDGYIVLATSINVAKGTIFHTPFGYDGKIYDTCSACHEAWLDVYTQWIKVDNN